MFLIVINNEFMKIQVINFEKGERNVMTDWAGCFSPFLVCRITLKSGLPLVLSKNKKIEVQILYAILV